MRTHTRLLLAALAAGIMISPASADKAYKRSTAEDQIYDQHIHGASGIRYPGDVATPVGNYHERGGKKIPYIERCHWTYEINSLGLPWHFRQVCRRYYGKPLNED